MKHQRQAAILRAVQHEPIRSQEQLRRRLRAGGFDVTQATLSRDIRELGLVKGGASGAYQTPAAAPVNGHAPQSTLQRALADQLLRVDRVQQLVLLRTGLGHANSLCAVLDAAQLSHVVGTLAGEDTILVITPDPRRAKALVKQLEELAGA
jgi:transcriptional regulator of arginine metabolism